MAAKKLVKVQISITIDPRLLKRVDAAAKKIGSNRSAFFESAVAESIDDGEALASLMGDEAARRAWFGAMSQPGVIQHLAKAMGETVTQERAQQMLAFMGTGKVSTKKPA